MSEIQFELDEVTNDVYVKGMSFYKFFYMSKLECWAVQTCTSIRPTRQGKKKINELNKFLKGKTLEDIKRLKEEAKGQ